jgi:hypothetical protein
MDAVGSVKEPAATTPVHKYREFPLKPSDGLPRTHMMDRTRIVLSGFVYETDQAVRTVEYSDRFRTENETLSRSASERIHYSNAARLDH